MHGLVLVSLATVYPLAFLLMYNAFEMLDTDMEGAARGLGAGRLRILTTVTLPLAWPALVAGYRLLAPMSQRRQHKHICYTGFSSGLLTAGAAMRRAGSAAWMLAGGARLEAFGADGVALIIADEDSLARAKTSHTCDAFERA
jgi:binding-protein-dependent transport system inner membrane component